MTTPPFPAHTKKRIPRYALDEFIPGQKVVAVRVDPADHSRVGIDLTVPPPEVRMAAGFGVGSGTTILALGTPCQAVIVESKPLGMKDPSGTEVYTLKLTILTEGVLPYQITVEAPVPTEAFPLLYSGSKVPAKFDSRGAREAVAIDWTAALVEVAGTA